MSVENDKIEDIVEEMRGNEFDDPHLNADGIIGARVLAKGWADRIEAAWKREKSQSWHHREMEELVLRHEKEVKELKEQIGNAAALREAVEFVSHLDDDSYTSYDIAVAIQKAKAALSSPPRNCDIGTADEQAQRYDKFCEGTECVKCPVHALWHHYFEICKNGRVSCGLMWAQMPYDAEGGAGK